MARKQIGTQIVKLFRYATRNKETRDTMINAGTEVAKTVAVGTLENNQRTPSSSSVNTGAIESRVEENHQAQAQARQIFPCFGPAFSPRLHRSLRVTLPTPLDLVPQLPEEEFVGDGGYIASWRMSRSGVGALKMVLGKHGFAQPSFSNSSNVVYVLEGGIQTKLDSATKRINETSPCSGFHDFLEKKGEYSTFIHPSMAPSILHGARGFCSSSGPTYQIYEPLEDAEITPNSILFPGCDYSHWIILMKFPTPLSPDQMIYQYELTCGRGLGISLRNARKEIYACSTDTYTGFQVSMKEEESKKFNSLPGVVFVLPDSYIYNEEYGGDRYEEGVITPRRRLKFKAAGADDNWDPRWNKFFIGGGAKEKETRKEIEDRVSPGDDPTPLIEMNDILGDLLKVREPWEVTSSDFPRQLHGRAATMDLFSIEGTICENVVENLQVLYGLWEIGDPEDKRSTPRDDYKELFKREKRFQGI